MPEDGPAGTRVLPELAGNINRLPKPQRTPSPVPKSIELTAKSLGDLCLRHLAENPDQLAEFMGVTGYSPDAIRRGAGGTALARGLVDYFASNEPLLLALCANGGFRPDDFMRVWAKLNPAG